MAFTKIDRIKKNQDSSRDPEFLARQWIRRKTGLYMACNLIDIDTYQEHEKKLLPVLAEAQTRDPDLLNNRGNDIILRTGHSVLELEELGLPIDIDKWSRDKFYDQLAKRPDIDELGELVEVTKRRIDKKFDPTKSEGHHYLVNKGLSGQKRSYGALLNAVQRSSVSGGEAGDFLLSDVPLYNTNPWAKLDNNAISSTRHISAGSVEDNSLVSSYDRHLGRTEIRRNWDKKKSVHIGVRVVEIYRPK